MQTGAVRHGVLRTCSNARLKGTPVDDTPAGTIPPIGPQLTALAELSPDLPAITCDGVTITRGELDSATNRLAHLYRERGVRQGDYLTIVLPNSIEWVQAAIAAWKLGAIVQPLSSRLPETEFGELLALVPRALLVGRHDPAGVIPHVPRGFVPSAEFSDSVLEDVVSPAWKAMASGGSTGRPKLIEATADSRLDPAPMAMLLGLQPGDTQLVPGPLSHNMPITTTVYGLLLGQHVVLMSQFDAEQCLRLLADLRVGFMSTVPTVLNRLLTVYRSNPHAYDTSSLKRLWHMAAPCPPAVKQAWIEILGADAVWELYGGTEVQAVTIINGEQWMTHRGSVGQVAMGQMKVIADSGEECPAGTVGEIFMRPDAGPTYRYIGSRPTSRDGWDTIGDMGWFDEDGFLYLSDRRVDMFNVGGRKVYPAEIEVSLGEHPGVLSCLAVGVPDGDLGQVPYVLVEADPDAGLDDEAVKTYLAERIANYKVPRFVEFRTTPLRDAAGKARRSAVRAEILGRAR
jgi:bile acid-coenzyme A ligase